MKARKYKTAAEKIKFPAAGFLRVKNIYLA